MADYPDDAFDFVVLSQTIRAMKPRRTLERLLRIGGKVIVPSPISAIGVRMFMFQGGMPVCDFMPYEWHETSNIHFCTIRDFVNLCHEMEIEVLRSRALDQNGQSRRIGAGVGIANLFGQQAVFLLRRKSA